MNWKRLAWLWPVTFVGLVSWFGLAFWLGGFDFDTRGNAAVMLLVLPTIMSFVAFPACLEM